jgi:hypothetical protein
VSESSQAVKDENSQTYIVATRFRGPPFSGNGGYVAGSAAEFLNTSEPVEVTLRSPIPLDDPMALMVNPEGGGATIWHGETLIAELKKSELVLSIPTPPDWTETLAAEKNSPALIAGFHSGSLSGTGIHPICFCCGADHDEGLKIFAAAVQNGEQVAAVWKTNEKWGDDEGYLPDAFLWTALDCPGQFAFLADGIMTGLLGRITGQIHQRIRAGGEYLVSGWRIGIEGKKHFAGTAIHDKEGNLIASAKSVWIGRQQSTS